MTIPQPRIVRLALMRKGEYNQIQILFVQRSCTEWYYPEYWELPGGGVEFNENPAEAIARELTEETGLMLEEDLTNFKPVLRNSGENSEHEQWLYVSTRFSGKLEPADHEIKAALWVNLTDVTQYEVTPLTSHLMNLRQFREYRENAHP